MPGGVVRDWRTPGREARLFAAALPNIVEWATAVDGQAAQSAREWLLAVPFIRLKSLPIENQNFIGMTVLCRMGAQATGAGPLLARKALGEQNQTARLLALSALGGMGRHAVGAVPDLLPLLKAPEEVIRESAAMALGKIGQRPDMVLAPLLADWEGGRRLPRKTVAYALAGFRDRRALAGLSQLATNPEPIIAGMLTWISATKPLGSFTLIKTSR